MFNALGKLSAGNPAVRDRAYNHLLKYAASPIDKWHKSWKTVFTTHTTLPVNTVIHGYNALITAGFTYPVFMRRYTKFNNPLVQLVYQTFETNKRQLNIIDVGAAIGDTAFLLSANIPGSIHRMLCIDGDKEFFSYLQHNMQQFKYVTCINTFLSSDEVEEKELVRTHSGTASAQGANLITAKPLDLVISEDDFTNIDVLKIDVDGFDGKVMAGAKQLLRRDMPNVIFEWHPILLKQTGNSASQCFDVLEEAGYTHFLFFSKFGEFSHYSYGIDKKALAFLEQLCLDNKFKHDWHYDVIALPGETKIDMQQLAACNYANNKISPF